MSWTRQLTNEELEDLSSRIKDLFDFTDVDIVLDDKPVIITSFVLRPNGQRSEGKEYLYYLEIKENSGTAFQDSIGAAAGKDWAQQVQFIVKNVGYNFWHLHDRNFDSSLGRKLWPRKSEHHV